MSPIKLTLNFLKTSNLKVLPTQGELNILNRKFFEQDNQARPELRPLTISDEDGGTVRRWFIEGAGWIVCRYDRWQLQRGNPVHGLSDAEAREYQLTMRYGVTPPRPGSWVRTSWLCWRESRELGCDLGAIGYHRRSRAQDSQAYWGKRYLKLAKLVGRTLSDLTALIDHE